MKNNLFNEKVRVVRALADIMIDTLDKLIATVDNSKLSPNDGKKIIEIAVEKFYQSIKDVNLRHNIK
ncbi:hypothetical protein M0R04_06140 [Candidatus Dojkabacteria bacterium]|jgi:hypothetical protein|nr:hypothetical protein [Candidatus Dojkabacteria bacterium]